MVSTEFKGKMTRNIKINILICILIVLCFALIVDKCLQVMSIAHQGGELLESPNGQYEAYIYAFETPALWTKFKRYYEFSIYDVGNNPKDNSYRYSDKNRIKCFRLEILHKKTLLDLKRSENNVIEWSPDSSEVTYSLEDVVIRFNINK
jgi:hypothetical protein